MITNNLFKLLLSILMITSFAQSQKLFRCFYYFEKDFMAYNLKDLYLENRLDHKELDYSLNLSKGKLWINICDGVEFPEQCDSSEHKKGAIIWVPNDKSAKCKVLLSSSVDENKYELLDQNNKKIGFKIQENESQADSFTVEIHCNKEQKTPNYATSGSSLIIQSRNGCGQLNEPARIFFNNKIVFSLVFMTFGIILLVFGGWKWDKLLTGVGFIAGVSFVFFVFWAFVQYEPSTRSYVIISIISVIIGGILGYLCYKFEFLSYLSIGFFGGFFLTRFLIATFPLTGLENWIVQLITYGAAVAVGVLCVFIGKYFMVLITSIIGSFLFWYNFGFLVGLLPNMFDFFEKFKTFGKLDGWNIGLLVVAGLTAFGFWIFQYKMIARDNRIKKEKNNLQGESLI